MTAIKTLVVGTDCIKFVYDNIINDNTMALNDNTMALLKSTEKQTENEA